MLLDGGPFADSIEPLLTSRTAHGCGEYFPLDDSGREVEVAASDENSDALDRRVEFFLFKDPPGIDPPVPGANSTRESTEYPTWRERADLDHETVIVDGEEDLFFRFDISSEDVGEFAETLRLFSANDAYDTTLALATDAEPEGEGVDLIFTRVLTDLTYSLEITPEAEDPYFLFENIPFEGLDEFRAPEEDRLAGNPLEPEPE